MQQIFKINTASKYFKDKNGYLHFCQVLASKTLQIIGINNVQLL